MWGVPLFPEQASTIAHRVDALYFFLIGVSVFFSVLIFFLVIYFAVKYRRRPGMEMPSPTRTILKLELFWIVVPLILVMIMFAWGASLYVTMNQPPPGALEIHVVGRQWMWKFQHPEGRSEINELHVPVGQPIRLTMISEDVIHSFYVPAFRVKMDVLPGRYSTIWFEANRSGAFHLFCAEYCGTQHSGMVGRVVAMTPAQYQRWLSAMSSSAPGPTMASAGGTLFQQLGCETCHREDASPRGPSLVGLYGERLKLESGETVVADEEYLRESIVNPRAKIVAGYTPLMPTFQGLVSEEALLQIIAYIKSLGSESKTRAAG